MGVQKKELKHFFNLLSGGMGAQLIVILSYPFLADIYGPRVLGMFFLCFSVVSFVVPIASLRYDTALMLAKSVREKRCLLLACLVISLLMSISAGALVYILSNLDIGGFGSLSLISAVLSGGVVFSISAFNLGKAYRLSVFQTNAILSGNLVKVGGSTLLKLGLGVFVPSLVILMISEWLFSTAAAVVLLVGVGRFAIWKRSTLVGMFAVLRRRIHHPRTEVFSSALNALAALMPLPIITAVYGVEAAGLYGMAYRIASVPNATLGKVFSDFFYMKYSKVVKDRQVSRLLGEVCKGGGLLFLVGIVPFGLFYGVSDWLVSIAFDEQWRGVEEVLRVLIPWMFLAFVVSSLSRVLFLIGRQDVKLIYDVFMFLSLVAIYGIASYVEIEFYELAAAMAAVGGIGYLIYFTAILYSVSKANSYKLSSYGT